MNVEDIDINKIKQVENIRLQTEEDASSLMSSIKQDGLLEPIGVVRDSGRIGEYKIIYGNRRLDACKKLGWRLIPAIIYDNYQSYTDFIIKNTMENVERKQITESELGRIFSHLKSKGNMIPSEIAARFSLPLQRVNTAIKIFEHIPAEYRSKIKYSTANTKRGNIAAKTADRIINIRHNFPINNENLIKLLELAREDGVSVDHVEILASLLHQGMELDDAIKVMKKYQITNIKVPILKQEIIDKKKKYKQSFKWIVTNILSGKLNDTFDIPIFEQKKKKKIVSDIKISNGHIPLTDSGTIIKDKADDRLKLNWGKFRQKKE